MAVGDSASFTVAATGDALTYQWRLDGMNLNSADTAKYTGVTEATLEVMNAVDVDDEGAYSVVISNAAGDVTSDGTAILTIRKYDLQVCRIHQNSLHLYTCVYANLFCID